ncbi:AAA family ATPase [Streptomyces sp. NPDC094038]|uniref:helix-turn-helix transcriptional regulator n=1 Tax=Streptomyces sp. NPDC094038 TaxID=3366055 RepID=UPI003820603D
MTEHPSGHARTPGRVPLVGRHAELRLLADHVTGAQEGRRGGAVLLVGEPGIGKTRLLDRLAASCPEHRVVRIAGVRSEAGLGFAALHRLLRPLLDGLDTLPPPQREALGAAFGLAPGAVPGAAADRYLTGLATLTLLTGAASTRPLLALVDNAQWLDPESADVLAFTGRCLHGDAVTLVLAGREGDDDRDYGLDGDRDYDGDCDRNYGLDHDEGHDRDYDGNGNCHYDGNGDRNYRLDHDHDEGHDRDYDGNGNYGGDGDRNYRHDHHHDEGHDRDYDGNGNCHYDGNGDRNYRLGHDHDEGRDRDCERDGDCYRDYSHDDDGGRGRPAPFDGMPVVSLVGLPPGDARDLLAAHGAGRVDPAVGDRIAAETGGNPLALLRLTRTLTAEQLSGTAPLPAALPVPGPLRAHLLRRVRALPASTRTLLLVMAAASSREPVERWRAAGYLGIPAGAVDPAVAAGLLTRGHPTGFRRPVARAAVYWGAEAADRRLVHAALAAVTDPVRAPDRRAWHRAEATVGLNAEVADELEAAARPARAVGGPAAEAAFLSRAAELSPADRAPRFLAAARAHLALGNPASAQAALDRAETELGPGDALLRARVRQTRARVDLYFVRLTGIPARLLDAAGRAAESDAPLARRLLIEGLAAVVVGHGSHGDTEGTDATTPYAFAAAVLASPALRSAGSAATDLLLRGLAARLHDDYPSAVPLLRQALRAFGSEPLPNEDEGTEENEESEEDDESEDDGTGVPLAVLALFAAEDVWDEVGGREACTRLVGQSRGTGALGALQTALMVQALWDVRAGRFDAARAAFEEAAELAAAMGLPPHGPAQRIELLAWSGREAETRAAAAEIAEVWVRRYGNDDFGDRARTCLAVLETSLGRYPQALACARVALEKDRPGTGSRVLHEVVEAGVRSGDHRAAKQALARLEARAAASGTPWARGLLARCRALMADDDHAEAYYAESVELLGRTEVVTETARSHLLFGEWLRRRKRRGDAREQLRTAHRLFTGMGAVAFAERARAELAATGEQARARTAPADRELTPREREVARLAAGGVMNADIAVRLFISVSTVEYHLGKVFRKLGITSRRHLASALDAEPRP